MSYPRRRRWGDLEVWKEAVRAIRIEAPGR